MNITANAEAIKIVAVSLTLNTLSASYSDAQYIQYNWLAG